jgi:MFS family permease
MSWIFLYTDQPPTRFLVIELIGTAVGVVAMTASGVIADRIGRRQLLIGTAAAIAALSGFSPQLLDGGYVGEAIFMTMGFILLGLPFGQASGAAAASFDRKYRYTASAITSVLAWLFGAGFAPCVALLLASHFGIMSSGAYLPSGAVCTVIALARGGKEKAPPEDGPRTWLCSSGSRPLRRIFFGRKRPRVTH